jgi:hypothetical protein
VAGGLLVKKRAAGQPGCYRRKGDGPGTLRHRPDGSIHETVLGHDAGSGLWLDTLADPEGEARVRAARAEVYARQVEAGLPLDYRAAPLAALALLGEGG